MAESELKVGDVVMLKSGGPAMTINWINKTSIGCLWFSGPNRMAGEFEDATVERHTPPKYDD